MTTIAEHLDRYRTAEFSLEELAGAAGRLLRRLAVRSADGRVAAAPDERSIRFYQTAGLVDRPLRYDGRRAVYGFRHLLQLLAVKRLQQEGQPLALIQRALAARATAELEAAVSAIGRGDAGAEDLEAGAERPAPAIPFTAPEARAVLSVVLQPGVTLTVDPAQVDDPNELIARVANVFARTREDR